MALAPFFERVYSAVGGHLSVSKDDLTSALASVAVGIKCGDTLSNNDWSIAELTTNLLARIYPRISIFGNEQNKHKLTNIAKHINPEIEIGASFSPEHTIGIGDISDGASLFPSAQGWVARLTRSSRPLRAPDNPYSSGAAAAFAAAAVGSPPYCSSPSGR